MLYVFFLVASFLASLLLTPLVRFFARKFSIVDVPGGERKIHRLPTPLLGGVAVYFAFVIALLLYLYCGNPNFAFVPRSFFTAIVCGGLMLIIGGVLDDALNLPPRLLWLFPAAAALVVVGSGIGVGIKTLSNPFGQPINLDFLILGLPASGVMVWLWLMGMMFTTKFLDGLDGLVSGVGIIAAFSLFFLSLTPKISQPTTAMLAILLIGSVLGFLIYNFNPASIFLGESGSTFIGFILGVLAIISGGKIATAFLVMGVPILDVAWVILRRLLSGKSPFRADRFHLHFRLLDLGFSQRQVAVILYTLSALFGFTAVFLQSFGKLIALLVLFVTMFTVAFTVVALYRRKMR